MIDFAQNMNALGPPDGTLDAVRQNAESILDYPGSESYGTGTNALAEHFNIDTDQISIGAGATSILHNIYSLLHTTRAVVLTPTFWQYDTFATKFNLEVKKIPYNESDEFSFNTDRISESILPGDTIFICNINNPTSVKIKGEDILKLVVKFNDCQFIIDETYLMFSSDFTNETLVKYTEKYKNLHIVLSLSKLFAIPGVRAGVLISNKDTILEYENRVHIPYSIGPLVHIIIKHIISDAKYISDTRNFYKDRRLNAIKELKSALAKYMHFYKPDGNFILARSLTSMRSRELVEKLKSVSIDIRGGYELKDLDDSYCRFAIRDKPDTSQLINALLEIYER